MCQLWYCTTKILVLLIHTVKINVYIITSRLLVLHVVTSIKILGETELYYITN